MTLGNAGNDAGNPAKPVRDEDSFSMSPRCTTGSPTECPTSRRRRSPRDRAVPGRRLQPDLRPGLSVDRPGAASTPVGTKAAGAQTCTASTNCSADYDPGSRRFRRSLPTALLRTVPSAESSTSVAPGPRNDPAGRSACGSAARTCRCPRTGDRDLHAARGSAFGGRR